MLALFMAISTYAQPKANFTTNEFDNFTLHTYASFDAMADVSFIIESENSLVIIEPQAFKGKVEEFVDYTNKLNKPIEKVFVSFHAAGLKSYPDITKATTKSMAAFSQSEAAKGMLGYFDQAFNGAMDTEIVEFDEQFDANDEFTVDGITYKLEPTSLQGMPGVNIDINGQVYYQHFAPAKGYHASKNMIKSKAAIDGALTDAIKAKKAGYTLFLGSHGYGKAGVDDLNWQIKYLKTMQKIAEKATTADEFIAKMNEKYPDCKGEEDLKGIAAEIYE